MLLFNRIELKKERLCGHVFCCKICRKTISPFAGTFFEGRRLSLITLFQLMAMFLLYVEQKTAAIILKIDEHTV